jgi:hypothetical protein
MAILSTVVLEQRKVLAQKFRRCPKNRLAGDLGWSRDQRRQIAG